jgi:chromate transporter
VFWVFSLLALQGFGGVMVVTQRELVERRRWLSREQFLEDWAVAQILPGPNVANLAVLLGDRYLGLRGAVAAQAGLFLFPLMLLLTLAFGFGAVRDLPWVQGALRGMGIVVAALILNTALKLAPALASHPGGRTFCAVVALVTVTALVVAGWSLGPVVIGVGLLSCLWTWYRLGQAVRAGGRSS